MLLILDMWAEVLGLFNIWTKEVSNCCIHVCVEWFDGYEYVDYGHGLKVFFFLFL